MKKDIIEIEFVEKFNPYHDQLGRFTTAGGATSFTWRTKDPLKQGLANRGIEREKARTAEEEKKNATAKFSSSMANAYGADGVEKMQQKLKDAPEEIQKVWAKYGANVEIDGTKNVRSQCYKPTTGKINVNVENDKKGSNYHAAYDIGFHESAHAIDHQIAKQKPDLRRHYSVEYKDGLFEKTLIKEADSYIKNYQKKLSAERGEKVRIDTARHELGNLMKKEGALKTGDVSDMLEGATKGKFSGSMGHGKTYWAGRSVYGHKLPGKSVAAEAFAEMFSATITNPQSLSFIKEVFPESYGVFTEMLRELQ